VLLQILEIKEKLIDMGIFHLFCLLDLVDFEAPAGLDKIDCDGVTDEDFLLVSLVAAFVEHLAKLDILVLLLQPYAVREKPELLVADEIVGYLGAGDVDGGELGGGVDVLGWLRGLGLGLGLV